MSNYPPLYLKDIVKFGKYKIYKMTVYDLIDKDAKYVQWLVDNDIIQLDNLAFKTLEKRLECM